MIETIHTALTERFNTSKYVKATDVNMLFHTCQSIEQLDKAKEILARYSTNQPIIFSGCTNISSVVSERALATTGIVCLR